MIRVEFDKDQAQQFLAALDAGRPLVAPHGAWTAERMLALAGVLHFAVMNKASDAEADDGAPVAALSDEQRAVADEQLFADLRAAIEWNSNATMQVVDDLYDYEYETTHEAEITGGDEPSILPLRGFKSGAEE